MFLKILKISYISTFRYSKKSIFSVGCFIKKSEKLLISTNSFIIIRMFRYYFKNISDNNLKFYFSSSIIFIIFSRKKKFNNTYYTHLKWTCLLILILFSMKKNLCMFLFILFYYASINDAIFCMFIKNY